MGTVVFTGGIGGAESHPDVWENERMSEDSLARLRALAMGSEARWRALEPKEAARFVYYLQRLRMTLTAPAAEVESPAAPDRCGNE